MTISSPADDATVDVSPAHVMGGIADPLSGLVGVSCNNVAGTITASTFACDLPLADGPNAIAVNATDAAGNAQSATVHVTLNPNHPPTARAGGPYVGDVATALTVDGSASSDPDNDRLSYAWSFGDGGTATGNIARHTYQTTGAFTITLTVSDGRGGTHSTSSPATIRAANRPPTANCGGPYRAEVGASVAFDAAGSADPDTDPLQFIWTFGDGATASGASAAHVYTSAGTFVVSLSVTDGRGGSSSAATQATIVLPNHAPSANAGGPYSGEAGLPIRFDGRGSTDPDSDALTYSWTFGDGSVATGATPSHVYATSGTFVVTITASDGRGATATQSTSATIAVKTNHAPVANPGGPYIGEANVPVVFSGAASVDPDRDQLVFAWDFGDGSPTGSGSSPGHVFTSAGTFTVTLTVTDTLGLSHSAATTAAIAAAVDRAPPQVTLAAPAEVLPGTDVTVTARPADNSRVETVAFQVADAAPVTFNAHVEPLYAFVVHVPDVAAPGTAIPVSVAVVDKNGNTGRADATMLVAVVPDTEKPSVSLICPPSAARSTALRLAATATDNVGIASVRFSVGSTAFANVAAPPYEATYSVPDDTNGASSLDISAEATDFTGNRASTTCAIDLVQAQDTTAPTVRITAPPDVTAGQHVMVLAVASDDTGIASVSFSINGTQIGTAVAEPYSAEYVVPVAIPFGARLTIQVVATDFAGNTATGTAEATVLGPSGGAEGLISGEVYDDTTGLLLAGATATLVGTNANGQAYVQSATSDERGRYIVRAPSGRATVRVAKAGWTTVDRSVDIVSGQAVEPIDARLTPLGPAQEIAPVLGGTLSADGVTLTIPAGALAATSPLILTRVGQQGLQGVLPAGWSPIAVVDIATHGITFDVPASLQVPVSVTGGAGRSAALAYWDEPSASWHTVVTATLTADETALGASIAETRQFAWLLRDEAPVAPPMPSAGDLLAGVPRLPIPQGVTAAVNPQPKIIFYQPGVHSDVSGEIAGAAAISSGVLVWSRVTESYQFYSGAQRSPAPYTQDLFMYQAGANPAAPAAAFVVTPTLVFEPLTLETGVITVELQAPPAFGRQLPVVGADGGTVTTSTGERVEIAPRALATMVPVELTAVAAADLGVAIPADLQAIGALSLSIGGATLALPAILSIPQPPSFDATSQVLVGKVEDLPGGTRLVLIATAEIVADRIVSRVLLPKNQTVLPGATTGGRYVFLRALKPVGFVAGQVITQTGDPFVGAFVTSDSLGIGALSATTGAYAAAAGAGEVTLTAFDLQRGDTGAGTGTIAAAGDEIALDLRLVAQPPQIIAVTPAEGATGVPLAAAVTIKFSKPIDPATVSGRNAANVVLATADAITIPAALTVTSNDTAVTLRPAQPLTSNTAYVLSVAQAISDKAGATLTAPLAVHFTTLDTSAPPMPPAANISAGIPANGVSTIVATQGTASPHDTVSVINLTTGLVSPVLVEPNGSFTVSVAAAATDKLRISIIGSSGNETLVSLQRFQQTNADGSLSAAVGAEGGRIEGPGGIVVDVPQGAFPEGTVVTLKPIAQDEYPYHFSAQQQAAYSWSGGLQLDLGGKAPKAYLNVGIPLRGGEKDDDQWVVLQAITVDGVTLPNVVDTARVIGHKITTSSPPCPGVTGNGIYGFLRAARPMGLIYGPRPNTRPLPGGVFVPFLAGPSLQLGVPASWGDVASSTLSSVGTGQNPLGGLLDPFGMDPFVSAVSATWDALTSVVCMPLMSGRVTITPNVVSLIVNGLTDGDQEVVVTNTRRSTDKHFVAPFPSTLTVEGGNADVFNVQAFDANGAARTLTWTTVQQQFVHVKVSSSALSLVPDATRIVLRNTSTQAAWSSQITSILYDVDVILEGAITDTIQADLTDSSGGVHPLLASLLAVTDYPIGTGNLLVRAMPGTIDPTRAQIDAHNALAPPDEQIRGAGVTKIFLEKPGSTPDSEQMFDAAASPDFLVGGAFIYAFEGDFVNGRFYIDAIYEDGKIEATQIPNFHITIKDPTTGAVVRTVGGQLPPPGRPFYLDTSTATGAASLVSNPNGFLSFDPKTPLTLEFSEPLSASSLANMKVSNTTKSTTTPTPVPGHWQLSNGNKTATFVPDGGLQLASSYRVSFVGVTTLAGAPLGTKALQLRTFKPKRISVMAISDPAFPGTVAPIGDMALLYKPSPTPTYTLVAITPSNATFGLQTIDVSDPAAPVWLGTGSVGSTAARIALQSNVDVSGGLPLGTHDVAVASASNLYESHVAYVDVTTPSSPIRIGGKLLTANPDNPSAYTEHGTYKQFVIGRGVDTLGHQQGHAAYIALAYGGLAAVEMEKNIPEKLPDERQMEGFYPGDYYAVVTVGDNRVVALNKNNFGVPSIDVFDPNLAPTGSVALEDPGPNPSASAGRLEVVERVEVDRNGDGTIQANERFDVVFVGGQAGIRIVNVNDPNDPVVIGKIDLPGPVRQMAVGADGRSLLAGVWRDGQIGVTSWYLIDCSDPFKYAFVDADGDQHDDRIAYDAPYPGIGDPAGLQVSSLLLDAARGLAYVGTSQRLEVWAISRDAVARYNTPPIANAGPDADAKALEAFTLDGRGSSDADRDLLSYSWVQTAGPSVTLDSPNSPQPTFTPPDNDRAVLTFQLIVNDGVVDSVADTVAITIKKADQLHLQPGLIALLQGGGSKQLTATIERGSGATDDVTMSADTTYEWIGGGTGLPDITPVLNALSAKLGVTVPLAQVSVSASGALTATSDGVQIVRAKHKNLTSELTVVLVGFKLKEISLKPESPLTALAGLVVSALGSDKNPPLVLATTGSDYLLDRGVVMLDDVKFQFLGTGPSIAISDLANAIKPIAQKALTAALAATGPAAPILARALTTMMGVGVGYLGSQSLNPLESGDNTIASVSDQPPFRGSVRSGSSGGLTRITGTLDLGDFGKADDSVAVFVLGSLESVRVELPTTTVSVADSPVPGPKIRTYASVLVTSSTSVRVTSIASSQAELLGRFLPDGQSSWATRLSKDFTTNTPAANLKFHVEGTATPSCTSSGDQVTCDITFTDVRFGFPVPTSVTAITNTYTPVYTSVGKLGAVESFDVRLVHQGLPGETPIANRVSIPGLGSKDATARFVVNPRGCDLCLDKKVIGDLTAAAPGQSITFAITATNKSTSDIDRALVDTATFDDGTGPAPLVGWTLTPGPIAPSSAVTQSVTLTAPAVAGTIQNSVMCAGCPTKSVKVKVLDPSPTCTPCILKQLSGSKVAFNPGEPLLFTVIVWNNSDVDVTNVVVVDTTSVNGSVVSSQDLTFGTIKAHAARQQLVPGVAPASPVDYSNTIACQAPTACTVLSAGDDTVGRPVRRPLINEVVVEPQQDWGNDGPGGDGVAFNDPPGSSAAGSVFVTTADQWIEILTNTGDPDELRDWTIEFTDASGAARAVKLPTTQMQIFGHYVVVGDLGGIDRDSVIALRDDSGGFVDTVDLKAIQAQKNVGYATGASNESVARVPNGSVGTSPTLFKRKAATIGAANPDR